MKKIKLGVMFGGRSAEHEVSIRSAKNIMAALDQKKYKVIPIKIARNGRFDFNALKKVDVVFPVLHGPYGEDGSIQGMFKFLDIPFVGPGILGSALGMDKEVMKRLMHEAGIPIAKYLTFRSGDKVNFQEVKKALGMPVFVKPANLGSSVGISKATTEKELDKAVKEAFKYDTKIVIEEMVRGRELECAVLGNEKVRASVIGEVIPKENSFYSYEAKYIDDDGAKLVLDVKLGNEAEEKIKGLAVQIFKLLECEGMSRVDFFLKADGTAVVNEINTIPGFTSISMYPKLFELSGISYSKLLDTLIDLAMSRHSRDKKLKTTVS